MKGGSLAAAAAIAHAKSLAPSSAAPSASSSSASSGLVGASPLKPGGASAKAAAQAFGPDELVILRQLGRGASGIVYLALHLPTLALVAQKTLNVFQQDVRHQVCGGRALTHTLAAHVQWLIPHSFHISLVSHTLTFP
jgi:hypothetical protein